MTTNNTFQNFEEEGSSFNFKRYIGKIIANWPLFFLSLIISFAAAYLINRYTEPIYSVSATIMVNEEKKGLESLLPGLGRINTKKNLQNEVFLLKSYDLINRTVKELDFEISYNIIGRVRESKVFRTFFYVKLDTSANNKVNTPIFVNFIDKNTLLLEIEDQNHTKATVKIGEKYKSEDFNFTIYLNKEIGEPEIEDIKKNKYFFSINDVEYLTNYYRAKLIVNLNEKQSSVLTLSISGPMSEQSTAFINKLSEIYLRNNLEEKNKASINAISFINTQLAIVTDSLKIVEQKLQNFRVENKVLDITEEGTNAYNRIKALGETKFNNDLKLKYCEYLEKYINSKANMSEIIAPSLMGINEPILTASVNELINIFKERGRLGFSAQADNPSVAMLNLKMEKALEALRENLKEIKNSTIYQNKMIDEKIMKEEMELFELPASEREYLTLKREYDINNSIFSFLLQKRAEAGITKASNLTDNSVVDRARSENATLVTPKRSKNYLTALILGLLIPIGIIFLMEFLNSKITDMSDFSKLRHGSIIGSVGHNSKSSEIPVFEFPKSALAESFRSLRTNLKFMLHEKGQNTILITSTISGEGKTFCAINLATILAMSDKKTLLIALDLRKPRVHKYFNISNDIGLSTYLINQNTKEEIVSQTNIKNLYLISSGPTPPNPAELIETERMDSLMVELRKEFDYIILDTPPVAIVTDALLLSKYSDATIYVVRQNFSSKEVLNLADELSEKGNLKQLNILVNDVKVPGYYGYTYRYGSRYGYSYGYGYGYYASGHDYYGDEEAPKTFRDKLRNWLGTS